MFGFPESEPGLASGVERASYKKKKKKKTRRRTPERQHHKTRVLLEEKQTLTLSERRRSNLPQSCLAFTHQHILGLTDGLRAVLTGSPYV